jgi:hypothetical protein
MLGETGDYRWVEAGFHRYASYKSRRNRIAERFGKRSRSARRMEHKVPKTQVHIGFQNCFGKRPLLL